MATREPPSLLQRLPRRARRGRRLRLCLLASLLVHLLAVVAYQLWGGDESLRRALRPVRYAQGPALPRPAVFRPVGPTLPPATMAPVPRVEPPLPSAAPEGTAAAIEPSALPSAAADLSATTGSAVQGDAKPTAGSSDGLPTLEQMRTAADQALRQDRADYARAWLPDADTTDAASARRRRGRLIVLAAVEAMGGRDALLEIRDLSFSGRFHKSFGPRSRYARWLPGGARLIYDGDRAFVDAYGEQHDVSGEGLREIRRVAERWDFLSRYLGDGVDLEYLGTGRRRVPRRRGLDQVLDFETLHAVRVNDRRHGGFVFNAYFEAASGLLQREDFPCQGGPGCQRDPLFEGPPVSARFYGGYERVKRALLWTRVDSYSYTSQVFVGPPAPVSWDEIDPRLFAPSAPDTAVVAPRCCETQATVWLHVGMPGLARPDSVLPAASDTLSRTQRIALRNGVRRALHQELRRHGVFARVAMADASDPGVVPAGDYLLSVTIYDVLIPPHRRGGVGIPPRRSPPVYQATLLLAAQGRRIMQDGPPHLYYHLGDSPRPQPVTNDRSCDDYQFRAYSIDETSIYTQAPRIRELTRRTVLKVASAVQQVEAGEDAHMLYTRDCCFCEGP